MRKIWMASALALSLSVGALGTLPVQASSNGRKNTTIGLGAAAAYELLRGHTTTGVLLGAGAAYGYSRYKDAKRGEDRYGRYGRRHRGYDDRYDRSGRYSDRYRYRRD
jgi:hypothetical protein